MERPLSALLNAFYHVHASSLNRGDYHLYQVLAYIGLFRLGEVTFPRFLGLLASQVPSVGLFTCVRWPILLFLMC